MNKNIIKEQIVQMLNIINEEVETINKYQNKIPQIDKNWPKKNKNLVREFIEKNCADCNG